MLIEIIVHYNANKGRMLSRTDGSCAEYDVVDSLSSHMLAGCVVVSTSVA
jgi:hypothetical protein